MSDVEKNLPTDSDSEDAWDITSLSPQRNSSRRSLPNNIEASGSGHQLYHLAVLSPKTGRFDLPQARSEFRSKGNSKVEFASGGIPVGRRDGSKTSEQHKKES